MSDNKRTNDNGFVGMYLTQDLLKKLDAYVKKTTLNRSQVIRLALIEYLKEQ
jgi:metal-responsive CopG/Arc/MetJ family transcriptional regulator